MYDLKPKAVFAHERVFDHPLAIERMERMLDALGMSVEDVPVVTLDDVDEIIAAAGIGDEAAPEHIIAGGHGRLRQGVYKVAHDPVLVFNTFVWDESKRQEVPRQYRNPHARRLARQFAGVGRDFAFSRRDIRRQRPDSVCQGGWGIHSVSGCVHKCDYCGQGFLVDLMLDLEDFCDVLTQMFDQRPEQKLYRYDLYSDILAFEPEYGCSEVVGRCFDQTDDKYLLLYTRSDNVAHLLDLPCKTHSLINWTISMDTVCRVIERDSPSLDERIEAMRTCQDAGYVVRAGFTPIIPIREWRAETTDMLERLFGRVEPEVVRCWVLAMMDADEFELMFDAESMDPRFMRRMREDADELRGQHIAPFPLDVRAEIYEHYLDEVRRISPDTPVALCTDHPKLWEMLAPKLQMRPGKMFCCCGALSVPGGWEAVRAANQT
ncbi:MAG: spore photoproduct lyase family protein [Planctomycetota bacterium]